MTIDERQVLFARLAVDGEQVIYKRDGALQSRVGRLGFGLHLDGIGPGCDQGGNQAERQHGEHGDGDRKCEGVPEGQVNPHYAALIACIEEFGPLSPRDRIGGALRDEGYDEVESFGADAQFTLDVELWEVGTQEARGTQADALNVQVTRRGGEISDRYIGVTFTALRILGNGQLIQWLLSLPIVRVIDLPPQVDTDVTALLDIINILEGLLEHGHLGAFPA
jgi:hypothetical protein